MKKVYLIPLLLIVIILTANNTFSKDSTGIPQTTFSIGVLQGVIAALVIFAGQAFIWGIYRLYLFIFRVKPLIAGKWKTTFTESENNGPSHETVTLKQKGSQVSGEIEYDGEGEKIIYKFKGSFRDLILTATYESKDPQEYERGSFSLQYKPSKKFKGQYVTFSKKEDSEPEFIATEYSWDWMKK